MCWLWTCQYFLGKEHLVKKMADIRPRQSNLLQRNNFSGVNKVSLHFTRWGRDQLKKISSFFKHASSK
jgi:hypothetical protein